MADLRDASRDPGASSGIWREISRKLRAAREIYEGIYIAPYRSAINRAHLQQRDMLYLMASADLLGLPNPVAFYTLELYPELIESFHAWHLRLGMAESPDGGFRCC